MFARDLDPSEPMRTVPDTDEYLAPEHSDNDSVMSSRVGAPAVDEGSTLGWSQASRRGFESMDLVNLLGFGRSETIADQSLEVVFLSPTDVPLPSEPWRSGAEESSGVDLFNSGLMSTMLRRDVKGNPEGHCGEEGSQSIHMVQLGEVSTGDRLWREKVWRQVTRGL